MDFSISALWDLVRFTVLDPRAACRALMSMRLPTTARWLLFGLVATLSAVLFHIGLVVFPAAETAFVANTMTSPVSTAVMEAAVLLATVAGVYWVGRWRGGNGSFSDTLLVMSWLQGVLLCLQAVQIAVLLIVPPSVDILGLASLALSLWLLTQVIAELHGFRSAWHVLFGILGVTIAAAVIVAVIVAASGAGGITHV